MVTAAGELETATVDELVAEAWEEPAELFVDAGDDAWEVLWAALLAALDPWAVVVALACAAVPVKDIE